MLPVIRPIKIKKCFLYRTMGILSHYKPVLYGDDASPPVRFVKMTASILNIDLEYRRVDLFKNQNQLEYYKKINPLRKVPALEVKDTTICDSHAIAVYLCQTSGTQTLYPEGPILKARVNQMLFYNSSVLFPIDSSIMSNFFAGNLEYKEQYEQWYSAVDYLELILKKNKYLAGAKTTLCDLCVVSTVSSMQQLAPLTDRHARVLEWINALELFPFYQINKDGLQRLARFIDMVKKGKQV